MADELDLYEELKRVAKQVNRRLLNIERRYGRISWAGKVLQNKLSIDKLGGKAWTKGNRVAVKRGLTSEQYKYILKRLNRFLNAETSKIRGIESVKKKQIDLLKDWFDDDKKQIYLSDEDAENIYRLWEDEDIDTLPDDVRYELIYGITKEVSNRRGDLQSKDPVDKLDEIQKIIESHVTDNDTNIRDIALTVYNIFYGDVD